MFSGDRPYDSQRSHRLFLGTTRKALRVAAENGHEDVIRLVPDLKGDDAELWSQVVTNAVQFQQPEVFLALMKQQPNRIYQQKRHEVLTWAARHGNNDMINLIMADNNPPRNEGVFEDMMGPLCEAVRHGHLSAVKLFLTYRPLAYDSGSHSMLLAQNIAMSGNFGLFQLLREQPFWRRHLEWVFLPIAAQCGHLDFVRYAVEHRKIPQKDPFKLGHAGAVFEYMCRISVFLAVAAGHVSIVRWFAAELRIDMGEIELKDDGDGPSLFPLHLAVDSGNTDMVRLLTQELGVELLGDGDWPSMCEEDSRLERRYVLERWVSKSKMMKASTKKHPYISKRKAFQAFLLAKGLWRSFEVYFGSLEGFVSDRFRSSHDPNQSTRQAARA
jgi:hypothetical protein